MDSSQLGIIGCPSPGRRHRSPQATMAASTTQSFRSSERLTMARRYPAERSKRCEGKAENARYANSQTALIFPLSSLPDARPVSATSTVLCALGAAILFLTRISTVPTVSAQAQAALGGPILVIVSSSTLSDSTTPSSWG